MKTRAALCFAVVVACVPKPEKSYTADEVAKVESLPELMRIQADKADPVFGKRDQESFTDAEYAELAEVGVMIQATGARLADHFGASFDAGFVALASKLASHGKALEDAASAKDAPAAGRALGAMRDTCKECHTAYR
jgi:hypothetical protein